MKGLGNVVKQKRTEVLCEEGDIIFLQNNHQANEVVNVVELNWSGIYEKAYVNSRSREVATIISFKNVSLKQIKIKRVRKIYNDARIKRRGVFFDLNVNETDFLT